MRERLFKVVTISFLVLLVGNAMAEAEQGEHHRMHRGHGGMMHDGPDINRIVEHMSRKLELDDTQQLAIRNIVDAVKPEAEALREQAQANREAIHTLATTSPGVSSRHLRISNSVPVRRNALPLTDARRVRESN